VDGNSSGIFCGTTGETEENRKNLLEQSASGTELKSKDQSDMKQEWDSLHQIIVLL
jgi:hypothetical protein